MVISPNLPPHCGEFESTIAFLSILSDCFNNAYPNHIGIRHEVLVLAREGMRQSAIAGRVGLTRATVNRILQRHVAIGTSVPGKSKWASRKTIPRHDHALFRMVRQDRFISEICRKWGLTGQPSTSGFCPAVTMLIDPQGSPCSLPTTAVSAWSEHRGSRTWQWPIGSMPYSVTSPGLGYVVYLVGAYSKGL